MALFKGDKKLSFWQGDRKPYGLFREVKSKKNLIPFPYTNVTASKENLNYLVNNDGTIIVNGKTTNNNSVFYLAFKADIQFESDFVTISGTPKIDGVDCWIECQIYNTKSRKYEYYSSRNGGATKLTAKNKILKSAYIVILKTDVPIEIKNAIFKPQIEEGTEATPYEPYKRTVQLAGAVKKHKTGTKEISFESVYKAKIPSLKLKGMGFQKQLSGKNVFDPEESKKMSSPLTKFEENKITFVQGKDKLILKEGTFKANTRYTLSYTIVNTNSSNSGFYILYADGTYQYSETRSKEPNRNIVTTTHSDKTVTLIASFGTDGENVTVANVQIEEGVEATEYEEYCGGTPAPNPMYPVEPVWNQNNSLDVEGNQLIPFPYADGMHKETDGITFDVKKDGRIVANGTATDDAYFFINTKGIALNDSTATISGGKNRRKRIEVKTKEGFLNTDDDGKLTFSANNTEGILINVKANEICDNLTFKPMLNKGTTPKKWQPYVKPQHKEIPLLRGIPDTEYADEYEEATGDRKRVIKELVFTGDENWYLYDYEGIPSFAIALGGEIVPQKAKEKTTYCNCFKWREFAWASKDYDIYGTSAGNFYFKAKFKNLEEWKNFLKQRTTENNPVKVWYPLAEPIIEHLDDEHFTQDWSGTIKQLGGDCGVGQMEAVVYEEIE